MALWDELAALIPGGGGQVTGGMVAPAGGGQLGAPATGPYTRPPLTWVNAERVYDQTVANPEADLTRLALPRVGSTSGGRLQDLYDLAARSSARPVSGGAGGGMAGDLGAAAAMSPEEAALAASARFGPTLSGQGLGGFFNRGLNTMGQLGEGTTGRLLDVGSLFTLGQAISDLPQHHYATAEKHAAESAALYGIPKVLTKIAGPIKSWLAEHFPQLAAGEEEMAAGPDEETMGLAALLPILAIAAPSAFHYLRGHLGKGTRPKQAATAAATQQQQAAAAYRNIASQLQASMDQFYSGLSPEVQKMSGAGFRGNEMATLGMLYALANNPTGSTLPALPAATTG